MKFGPLIKYKAGVTLANLLHISFGSYSANTQNSNVTTLKINVIIEKYTIFNYSTHTIHKTLFWLRVKKIVRKQVWIKGHVKDENLLKIKLNIKQKLCECNFWNQRSSFYVLSLSLLNLVKYMWSKFLSLNIHQSISIMRNFPA